MDEPASYRSYTSASQGMRRAIWTCVILIAVVWSVHVSMIPQGGIEQWDEFYTLERSSRFAIDGDWLTVFTGDSPDFRKPPLQYWMTGALLEVGVDPLVALRLPSMVFALGCFFATGLLACAILPGNPWVMPTAILLCFSSADFWANATSGLLEVGSALSVTLALAAAILALQRPRWWYVVALAVGFGAWQKAPGALGVVVVFLIMLALTSRWHGQSVREVLRNRQFRMAAGLALMAVVAWPLFQSLRYGSIVWESAYADQIIDRFSPDNLDRVLTDLDELIINGEPVLRWLGILALLALPLVTRRPVLLALTLTFLTFVAAMYFAKGKVYPRYTLLFLPTFAAALAAVLLSVFRANWQKAVALAVVCAILPFPIKSAEELKLFQRKKVVRQVALLKEVGQVLQPDETLVVCNWTSKARFPPGAVSVYASSGQKFVMIAPIELLAVQVGTIAGSGKLRGLCTPEQLEEAGDAFGQVAVVDEKSGYVQWTSVGLLGER